MPACKKTLIAATIFFAAINFSFADSFSMPSMSGPTISSPTMPTISAPTLSQNFYKPGAKKDSTNKENSKEQENSENKKDGYEIYTSSDININIGGSSNTAIPTLNASDIESLGNMGLLNSLGMGSNPLSAFNQLMGSKNSTNTSVTYTDNSAQLQGILKELESIKKTLESNPTAQSNVEAKLSEAQSNSTDPVPSKNPIVRKPKILRWQVNGYNLLNTCTKIYFSDIEENKNFLLTGDRAYMSNGKQFKETFYMLFTAEGNRNGTGQYSVETNLSQEYENPSSFVYQISKMNKLNATKTGNLVLIRTSDPKFKLDMLIDIAK